MLIKWLNVIPLSELTQYSLRPADVRSDWSFWVVAQLLFCSWFLQKMKWAFKSFRHFVFLVWNPALHTGSKLQIPVSIDSLSFQIWSLQLWCQKKDEGVVPRVFIQVATGNICCKHLNFNVWRKKIECIFLPQWLVTMMNADNNHLR